MSTTTSPRPSSSFSSTSTLIPPKYTHKKSSIGGRGNYILQPITTPLSPIHTPSRTSATFLVGIGGAGNLRNYEECACISREDKLARRISMEMSMKTADRFHCGVGGRGNRVVRDSSEKRRETGRGRDGSGNVRVGKSNADKLKRGIVGLFGKRE